MFVYIAFLHILLSLRSFMLYEEIENLDNLIPQDLAMTSREFSELRLRAHGRMIELSWPNLSTREFFAGMITLPRRHWWSKQLLGVLTFDIKTISYCDKYHFTETGNIIETAVIDGMSVCRVFSSDYGYFPVELVEFLRKLAHYPAD